MNYDSQTYVDNGIVQSPLGGRSWLLMIYITVVIDTMLMMSLCQPEIKFDQLIKYQTNLDKSLE